MARPTICLSMIVKDEAPVIAECLQSVLPHIDAWVICDTGSTDTTREIIRHELRDLPGELHDRPWKNFGHNRTEAIRFAESKADYLLFIDADETLSVPDGFRWPKLKDAAYGLIKVRRSHEYTLPALVRSDVGWRWEGVVHEYLASDQSFNTVPLDSVRILSERRGSRARDPHTFRRDALLLEGALLEHPDDPRSVFYLAQSYRDCDDLDNAIRWYRRRAELEGWREEVFVSKLQAARCMQRRGDPWPEVQHALLDAFQTDPRRAEPLHEIGAHALDAKEYAKAELFLGRAAMIPRPSALALFVDRDIYAWRAKLNWAVSLYWLGRIAESTKINEGLLALPDLPAETRALVEENMRFCREA